jgi:hypothetical protein
MPDEEIDKLIKDAASQHHPPYDDTAWGKMEVLLDKHLPQKKDKKRPIIFLLSFLLLGSAVFFVVKNTQNNNSTGITKSAGEKKPGNIDDPGLASATVTNPGVPIVSNTAPGTQQVNQTTDLSVSTPSNTNDKIAAQKSITQAIDKSNIRQYADNNNKSYNQKGRFAVKIKKPAIATGDDNLAQQNNEKVKAGNNNETTSTEIPKANSLPDVAATNTEAPKTSVSEKTDTVNIPAPETEKASEKNKTAVADKKKNNKSFAGKFAITVSSGADVSFIEISNTGKIKPVYGAGLTYAIGKHLTISSGIYVSKKVYSAQPTQYKFPGGYTNPNLVKIDADCKVYEIPLAIYYNSRQVKNHNWLGGIGLSSFLMKNESYDYLYKTPAGQSYNYLYAVSNENKHYFSVLTLSGGYRYKLNNRISFIAEPYIKIPLGGIGLGKIKLNSTGLLFTAAIKPFAKNR